MADFRITVLNDSFRASDIHDFRDSEIAQREAIRGAIQIGIDELEEKSFFGAEVSIEQGQKRIGHFIVAVGVSSLAG